MENKDITVMGAVCAAPAEEIIFKSNGKLTYEFEDFYDIASISIYSNPGYFELPVDPSDEDCESEADSIKNGGQKIAEVVLTAIHGEALCKMKKNLLDYFDSISGDLGYVAESLLEERISLAKDIVYINSVDLVDGNEDILTRARIIKELPRICLRRFGFVPYLLAYIEEEGNTVDAAAFRAENYVRVGKDLLLVKYSDFLPKLKSGRNLKG